MLYECVVGSLIFGGKGASVSETKLHFGGDFVSAGHCDLSLDHSGGWVALGFGGLPECPFFEIELWPDFVDDRALSLDGR